MSKQRKSRKTATTSRKMGRPPAKLKTFGTFHREFPGQDPKKEFHATPKPDYEKELPEPKDEAAGLKYPPPKKHPTFRKRWAEFIENITARENFKVGHLTHLEILCDLYVEYEELQEFIRTHGRSYVSVGRNGEVWKFYPEVGQLNKVSAQIKDFSKMLGIVLKKDHSAESGGEKDDWS